ncbi:MAG: heavy-metal-associated domain-containing protein [Deltaproteobacteria bacterium]|nr:heavy-metal-associated domain-containing protein [Deltaproteobacteria bacterium]
MGLYIHDIPGRLRVKTPIIKGNNSAAESVQKILEAIEGVDSTAVNTLTGSVVVNYNAKAVDSARLLQTLNQKGYIDLSRVSTNEQALQVAASRAGGVIGKAILGLVLEKAFEGSALSLLTVLI